MTHYPAFGAGTGSSCEFGAYALGIWGLPDVSCYTDVSGYPGTHAPYLALMSGSVFGLVASICSCETSVERCVGVVLWWTASTDCHAGSDFVSDCVVIWTPD